MALIPNLPAAPAAPRPWWMTAIVTGQTTNARLPLSHLGALPRGAILVSLADFVADTSSTADADPGAGNLRWNHATQASATQIFIDDSDANANSLAALWATLATGGFLYLYQHGNLDVWQQWQITAVTDAAGYVKLGVTLQASNGSFADDAAVVVTIQQPNPAAGVDRNVVSTLASVSGTTSVDAALGDYFKGTLSENTTLAITNVLPACTLHISLTQASTARTVSWPGTFNWGAGVTPPTMPTAAGKVLDVMVTTNDSGASWIATARERA